MRCAAVKSDYLNVSVQPSPWDPPTATSSCFEVSATLQDSLLHRLGEVGCSVQVRVVCVLNENSDTVDQESRPPRPVSPTFVERTFTLERRSSRSETGSEMTY